jgi:hypothetical protein
MEVPEGEQMADVALNNDFESAAPQFDQRVTDSCAATS